MTAAEAAVGFLDTLANERRASPLTVAAYRTDIARFLAFLTGHLEAEPDLAALAGARVADFRAWLAAEAMQGCANVTRARHLAAVRSFYRWLARRHGVANPQIKLLATPRAKPPLPRKPPPVQALTKSEPSCVLSHASSSGSFTRPSESKARRGD